MSPSVALRGMRTESDSCLREFQGLFIEKDEKNFLEGNGCEACPVANEKGKVANEKGCLGGRRGGTEDGEALARKAALRWRLRRTSRSSARPSIPSHEPFFSFSSFRISFRMAWVMGREDMISTGGTARSAAETKGPRLKREERNDLAIV